MRRPGIHDVRSEFLQLLGESFYIKQSIGSIESYLIWIVASLFEVHTKISPRKGASKIVEI